MAENKQTCVVCLVEKATGEFKYMCSYGCTCTFPLVCAWCVLSWLETSALNAAGKNAPVSLSAWSCPVCRNQPAQRPERTPAFLTPSSSDPITLRELHDEW